ncbi:MAG TPA: energy-coupling factor transporter ATPase [Clostridiales bacterium]|jgi:energy-coupling factor transport system ATP-binding protein|nr:energy-coupling factor transporter ATPase [Clostridiales bacterium]
MKKQAELRMENLSFKYEGAEGFAVKNVDLTIEKGSFTTVLGHNGSGKSTLAKLINGLFLPTQGKVFVDGMDTQDEQHTWDVRARAGVVFQNPDNQIVATVVKDDVAFGLENIGVPHEQMEARIEEALGAVDMLDFIDRAPHMLSGGQKQRVAIAGIMAMKPAALILDEVTSMLDPKGRKEVFDTVRRLNKQRGITVVWITHFMEEAALSDRVLVMHRGEIRMDGTPREVFANGDALRSLRLDVPPMALLAQELVRRGIDIREDILSLDEMEREVVAKWRLNCKM